MAAVDYFKKLGTVQVISVDGSLGIQEVTEEILKKLP